MRFLRLFSTLQLLLQVDNLSNFCTVLIFIVYCFKIWLKPCIDCAWLPREAMFVALPRKVYTVLPRAVTRCNMVSDLRAKQRTPPRAAAAPTIHGLKLVPNIKITIVKKYYFFSVDIPCFWYSGLAETRSTN
jgi:hypothetical protein